METKYYKHFNSITLTVELFELTVSKFSMSNSLIQFVCYGLLEIETKMNENENQWNCETKKFPRLFDF